MATVNTTSKGVTSKIQEVQNLTVDFGAGESITVTHANDPLWGRQISAYDSAGLQLDLDAVTITAASDTTTTVLSTGILSGAKIVCVVPVT